MKKEGLNFAPQNPNAMLNPPMGGVPQNPPPNPAHGLGGDNMEGRSIHGGIGAPQFRTLRDYMNPPRQAPSSCIVLPPHYATLNIRPGTFMDKQPHEAYSYFDYLANLTRDWAFTGTQNPEGIKEALHGQVNAIGHYGQGARNPYSNTYNPGWRDHPNFGWCNEGTSNLPAYQRGFHNPQPYQAPLLPSQPQNYQPSSATSFLTLPKPFQPPPQAQSNTYQPPHKRSLEDTLQQFIQSQGGVNSRVDKTLDDIKSQLTLLTQALTLTEKVQAITVLRSGKTIDKTILPIYPKGRGEASKVVNGTVGGDRETGEKKESQVVSREEERKKKKIGLVPKSEEVLREERKQSGDLEDIWEVNLIESIVQEHFERQCVEDPLARMLMFGEGLDYLEVEKVGNFVNEDNGLEVCPVMTVGQWTPTFEPLTLNPIKPQPSELEAPTPERKPLPSTLKYVFLGESESYPVVISSSLTEAQERNLLEVFKKHRKAIGWNTRRFTRH
ncbi:hypothetical protein Acr_11g0011110 [Actinidia rufa]|uniref:Uncharacterized protein n=1 Tax=Actinidia rufa TaxID=165716 RepID=A0A7J0FDP3_9ERIC|nr:hypothetical protein Acr_11g0011110 [Actinidia rufa]